MPLQPQTDYAVPERTAEVALAAFPKGNRYMQMREQFGTLFLGRGLRPALPGVRSAGRCALAPRARDHPCNSLRTSPLAGRRPMLYALAPGLEVCAEPQPRTMQPRQA